MSLASSAVLMQFLVAGQRPRLLKPEYSFNPRPEGLGAAPKVNRDASTPTLRPLSRTSLWTGEANQRLRSGGTYRLNLSRTR